MKAILLGGTGFIGRALASGLLDKGWEVAVATRDPSRYADREGGIEYVSWDGGWEAALEGAQAVVNLVGENISAGRWTRERKARILKSRVAAGEAVVRALEAATNKPALLVQASATGWYGGREDEILDETSAPGTGFLSEVCRAWEASTARAEDMGVRRVVVRTGVVLGPGGLVLKKFLPAFKLFLGGPLGSGKQWFPWIHLRDEVRAILHLMEDSTATGAYNLTAPEPVTMRAFCRALGKAMKRPSYLPVPGFALKALLGEMAVELILQGQRALPKRLLTSGFEFRFPGVDAALDNILSA